MPSSSCRVQVSRSFYFCLSRCKFVNSCRSQTEFTLQKVVNLPAVAVEDEASPTLLFLAERCIQGRITSNAFQASLPCRRRVHRRFTAGKFYPEWALSAYLLVKEGHWTAA